MTCSYRAPDDSACARPRADGERFCLFHIWTEPRPSSSESSDVGHRHQLKQQIQELIAQQDGLWRGFAFPIPIALSNAVLDFEIDARDASFAALRLERVEFHKVARFSGAVVTGPLTMIGVTFGDEAWFDRAKFQGAVDVQQARFLRSASFYRSDFAERVLLRAFSSVVHPLRKQGSAVASILPAGAMSICRLHREHSAHVGLLALRL